MNVSAHAPDSLWGEIPEVSEIDSVKFVLEEQALALKRNTKGLLYGIVQMKTREGRFIVSLSIVAPSLDNYTQQILSVTHGIDSFPATINNSPDWPATECSDITEFKEAVGERLQSERVRKLIRGLLGMMRPAPDFEKPFA
jgi:hypothetical protein